MTDTNKPLAWLLALLTAAYVVAFRVLPYDVTYWLLWPFTAFGLYAGARLKWWQSLGLVLGVQLATDAVLYAWHQWPASVGMYPTYVLVALLGRWLLHTSHAPVRVFVGTTVGYALFFLITNAIAWAENSVPEYREKNFDTLMLAYRKGLEFLKMRPMQAFGQYGMAALVFGAHAVLAKVWFPAEVVRPETAR